MELAENDIISVKNVLRDNCSLIVQLTMNVNVFWSRSMVNLMLKPASLGVEIFLLMKTTFS